MFKLFFLLMSLRFLVLWKSSLYSFCMFLKFISSCLLTACLPSHPPPLFLFRFPFSSVWFNGTSSFIMFSNYFLFVWENYQWSLCEPGSCNWFRKMNEKSNLPSIIAIIYNHHMLEGDKLSQENTCFRRESLEEMVAWRGR